MNSVKQSISRVAWIAMGLFLAAMTDAAAQGAAPVHHHVKRYIALAAVVVIVVVLFALRARNAKKQTA